MPPIGQAQQPGLTSLNPTPAPRARVAFVSDRWQHPDEWERRGMALSYLPPTALEHLLIDPPAAIVLEPDTVDERRIAHCWQLHTLTCVPMIIIAPAASSDEVIALLERGADEVITQHPDAPHLAAAVAAILRRPRGQKGARPPAMAASQTVLRLEDGELDLSCRIVHRPGSSQTLSKTEFNLLQALLSADGRACSHAELVSRVWGAEYASATHYLRLYIRYLRQKIERDPLRPRHILNVRGIGYRLTLEPDTAADRAAPSPAPQAGCINAASAA